jgi:glycosyltransferase involved in cell wall biosynthesis
MIPAFNPRADYLEETLRSVLAQDPGPDEMQIEVVDDASPNGAPIEWVQRVAGDRVTVHCESKNGGLAVTWNRCVARAQGVWVHILHQDDSVLPGFYQKLEAAATRHEGAGLIATRSFFVNEEGVITGVTPRLKELEHGGHDPSPFFYANPLQCPGVAVRREFYAQYGGFRTDMNYALDCEMWARVISKGGGVVLPDVLARYRSSGGNETSRLMKSGENIEDLERLHLQFGREFPAFNRERARAVDSAVALSQGQRLMAAGDIKAARINFQIHRRLRKAMPLLTKLRRKIELMNGALHG